MTPYTIIHVVGMTVESNDGTDQGNVAEEMDETVMSTTWFDLKYISKGETFEMNKQIFTTIEVKAFLETELVVS